MSYNRDTSSSPNGWIPVANLHFLPTIVKNMSICVTFLWISVGVRPVRAPASGRCRWGSCSPCCPPGGSPCHTTPPAVPSHSQCFSERVSAGVESFWKLADFWRYSNELSLVEKRKKWKKANEWWKRAKAWEGGGRASTLGNSSEVKRNGGERFRFAAIKNKSDIFTIVKDPALAWTWSHPWGYPGAGGRSYRTRYTSHPAY